MIMMSKSKWICKKNKKFGIDYIIYGSIVKSIDSTTTINVSIIIIIDDDDDDIGNWEKKQQHYN